MDRADIADIAETCIARLTASLFLILVLPTHAHLPPTPRLHTGSFPLLKRYYPNHPTFPDLTTTPSFLKTLHFSQMFWDTFKILVLSVLTVLLFHLLLQLAQKRVLGHTGTIGLGLTPMVSTPVSRYRLRERRRNSQEGFMARRTTSKRSHDTTHEADGPSPDDPPSSEDQMDHAVDDTVEQEHDPSHSAVVPATKAHSPEPNDLESELKAWMQRESSNWAQPEMSTTVDQSTSLDTLATSGTSGTTLGASASLDSTSMDTPLDKAFHPSAPFPSAAPCEATPSSAPSQVPPPPGASMNNSTFCSPMNGDPLSGQGGPSGTQDVIAYDDTMGSYATV